MLHQFPAAEVSYRFKCRTPNIDLSPFIDEINAEIDHLCSLYFKDDELEYLGNLRFMKSDFIEFLSLFHLKRKYITVERDPSRPFGIDICIKGPWLHTILFEIPVLAIVNEVYFRRTYPGLSDAEGRRRLDAKIDLLLNEPHAENLHISDYGTRRRFSRQWQRAVIERLAERQALGPRLRDTQVFGFEQWAKEYRGDLGIALSDVYGMKPFLEDFDMYFCKLFDGARHDSGDPFLWGEKMIEHWSRNKCDPRTKLLIFSDGLNIPRVLELWRRFNGRVRLGFGIGTNLMNDRGPEPLNVVIKMTQCNGQPVAKISDSPEKSMCEDESYVRYLRQVFHMDDPTAAAKGLK